MLEGVEVFSLKKFADERGFFAEIMRKDWGIFKDEILQSNFSVSYPGIVRAWHRHIRGQVDYFVVLRGALKICAFDEKNREMFEVISTGENLQVVRIPGHYWHGFKVLGNDLAYLVYFTNRLYDYSNPDEERRPWNDPEIVPEKINGKRDERCGKPWDWFYPPHK